MRLDMDRVLREDASSVATHTFHVNPEQRQIRLHRSLLVYSGAAYLAWWLFVRISMPGAFNPFLGRAGVVACFFAVFAASYVWVPVARSLDGWLVLCCCIATAHYFYLFDRNHADLNWLVGSYITVTAVCVVLQTSRSLRFYSFFVAVLSVVLLAREQSVSYVVFLPGMLTNLLFANIGLHSRLRLLERVRESHEQIVRANRELEAFCYSVAHDLRAPLRAMSGFSHVLLEEHAERLDDEGKRHLERIAEGASQMGRLIDGLLSLARVTRKEPQRASVDLTQYADAVARQLRADEPARVVEFANQRGVVAHGDPQLLRTILDNLIGNAWKFTRKEPLPRVAFGAAVRNGVPVYYVEDNGAGFDMSHVDKLFSPFQRLHTVEQYPGTGIGLAIVHRIVERHGGRVWAEATVNRGATFYFTLQAAPPAAKN